MSERLSVAPLSINVSGKAVLTLDFTDHMDLFSRMQAASCTTEDVIGLLYMLFDNELAVVKQRRKAA